MLLNGGEFQIGELSANANRGRKQDGFPRLGKLKIRVSRIIFEAASRWE